MRKILSLVLVLSMVLGSFGFAFAAPVDVEGTDFEDAVTRLSALEILSGYADGTFKPEKTITRAEFAKIMANALGVGTAAQYANGATKFADVSADHWAAGYINVVSDMKIVNGYGDGNFGPENKVTYAEAITMIVRALGYEPKAKAIGGYPGGYIAIGAEEEITDDVNVINTLAATRGDVALMVDASLTVPLMYQKTWGQYPEYANDDDDKTLMKTKLGVDEITGVVTAIPNTDSTLDADEIKIDGDKYDVLVENFKYDSLLGVEVTVWEDGGDILDFDIETDEDEILFDTMTASTEDDVTLYVDDSTYDWADKAKVYVNFEEVDVDKDLDLTDAYGYVVLNEKEEVTYVNVFDFTEVGIGAVYEVADDVYSYVEPDANTEELELSDYEDGIHIYNDKMVLVDTDAIDVNSAIFAWESSDELYLVVKNETVEGNLERVKAREVKVDDTSYDVAYNYTTDAAEGVAYSDDNFDSFDVYNEVADLDNLGDEAVVAVLDLNSELILIHGDAETTSATMYGIVTYGEVGSKSEATVFTKDDEEVDYKFEIRSQGSMLEDLNYFLDQDETNEAADVTKQLQFGVMKFKLNADGEIADGEATIAKLAYEYDGGESKDLPVLKNGPITGLELGQLKAKDEKNYVEVGSNKYYISEDTVFMTALDSDGELSPSVLEYKDIYDRTIDPTVASEVLVFGTAAKDADMIVFLDKAFEGGDDDYFYGVVTDSPWKDGSDYVAKIDVFGEGEKEYVVKNEANFTEGQVVKFHFNSDDEIVKDIYGTEDDDQTFDYDDGYLTDISATDKTYKIPSDAVVYVIDADGIDDSLSVSKIDDKNYQDLIYILDEDEIIVAVTVQEKAEAAAPEETESDGTIAVVDYDVDTDATVRIKVSSGTKSYTVDKAQVVVLDGFGTQINKAPLDVDLVVGTKVNFTLIEGSDEIDVITAVELDYTAPEMSSITIDSATQITITFDEKVVTAGTNPTDFVVTDEDATTYLVTAQADGTAGDNKIVLTVADMSASEDKEITVTYTNNNDEVKDLATPANELATDATGVSATLNLVE